MLRTIVLKLITVILIGTMLVGCEPQARAQLATSFAKVTLKPAHYCVWERIGADTSINTHHKNPRVQYFIRQYTGRNAHNLVKHSTQAIPYLYHIVHMLEEKNIDVELALLPIVESEYRPQATSNRGAAGLWQLALATGNMYGLKKDAWYDGRRDVEAATKAAINHLEYLHKKYKGDWLLALAAYNAGAGRIDKAIRANKQAGKPTDYWSLNLPKETMYYVPKFLALVHVIQNAKQYSISLSHIPNKPYFSKVEFDKQLALEQAAKLAELDVKEIKRLNPALYKNTTHPHGPHAILLPVKNATIFKAKIKKL